MSVELVASSRKMAKNERERDSGSSARFKERWRREIISSRRKCPGKEKFNFAIRGVLLRASGWLVIITRSLHSFPLNPSIPPNGRKRKTSINGVVVDSEKLLAKKMRLRAHSSRAFPLAFFSREKREEKIAFGEWRKLSITKNAVSKRSIGS